MGIHERSMIMETRNTFAVLDNQELIVMIARYDYLPNENQVYFEVIKVSDGTMDFVKAERVSDLMYVAASNSQLN